MPPIPLLVALGVALLIKANKKAKAPPAPPAPTPAPVDPELERLRRQNERLKRRLSSKPAGTVTPPVDPPTS